MQTAVTPCACTLPDGQSLVFYSTWSGRYQFWAVHPDGSGLNQLTRTPDITFNYPVPSDDGRWRLKESRDLYEQPGRRISYVAVSPDGRRRYFTSGKTDADVSLMRFQRPKP